MRGPNLLDTGSCCSDESSLALFRSVYSELKLYMSADMQGKNALVRSRIKTAPYTI